MIKKIFVSYIFLITIILSFSFQKDSDTAYKSLYDQNISSFVVEQSKLLTLIKETDISDSDSIEKVIAHIEKCRSKLKAADFWTRYFEPIAYKKINGPLPVEWETEVFEKFEKPYKREGAGLTLAEIYLNEEHFQKDSLVSLIQLSAKAVETFKADSITQFLQTPDAFFFCNRLYLLNLATIYTTGFECPNTDRVITELQNMLVDVNKIYEAYNNSFPKFTISQSYLNLFKQTISFVQNQSKDFTEFNHFIFIKDYINPLFALNQQFITNYKFYPKSNLDYTLNNTTQSIFDKSLFFAQNTKGIYSRVKDKEVLHEIDSIGKLLFYDPILSGNNLRSCISCHKSDQFFTDTTSQAALQFNKTDTLTRNTPSLVNAPFNHLIMLDGKLLDLQEQGKTVITNPIEMGSNQGDVLNKVLSCPTYKKAFKKYLKYTPTKNKVSLDHIVSAITFYFGKFSQYYSPFDDSMNKNKPLHEDAINGFNLYMSKAQCATCHFAPSFSGIKPPYIGNEFEIIGVPADANYTTLSNDKGRYEAYPAIETLHAFRTTTFRNAAITKPYMHNGVFKTLEEVINFYDGGGGMGHNLIVENQTLSPDSLDLSDLEKKQLISFIVSLNEDVKFEDPPTSLPSSKNKELKNRKVGGEY